MYSELGFSVVAADLDPQANLSTVFLSEDRLEQVWSDNEHHDSILGQYHPYCAVSATSASRTSRRYVRTWDWWSGI